MAVVDLMIWQNVQIPYTPAPGTRPPAVLQVPCRSFSHAAVRTTLNNGNRNWFTTQLPPFVPHALPARILGPIVLPGARAPIILRNGSVEDTLVQAINRQLNLWNATTRLDLGGSNRPLWAFELRSSFAMAFWAGIKTGEMGFGNNDRNRHLLPDWMLNVAGPSRDFRAGTVTVPGGATLTTVGTRGPVVMQNMTLLGRRVPESLKYHTYNVGAFQRKAIGNRVPARAGAGTASGFRIFNGV